MQHPVQQQPFLSQATGGEVERQLLLHAVEHVERVQWRDDGHAVEEGWICVGRRKVGGEDAHQVAELVHTDEAVLCASQVPVMRASR